MTTPRPPAPLPRSARALLAAYRDAHDLPDPARERIWSVVGAEDAPAPAYEPLEPEQLAPRRRPRQRAAAAREGAAPRRAAGNVRWLGWGTATLAAAAVLLLAWQLGGSLAERRQASRTPGAAVMQGGGGSAGGRAGAPSRAAARDEDPSASPAAAPDASTNPAEPTTTPAPPAADARQPSEPAVRSDAASGATERSTTLGITRPSRPDSSRSQVDSHPAEPTEVTAAGSTLAAERELVARAWRALALGETTTALDAAAEHARRFPAGLLAPERAAIDTIARCRRGDADGPRRATTFHRAHPGSPLAERVDEACVAASKK